MKNLIKVASLTFFSIAMLSTTVLADSTSLDTKEVKALYYHNDPVINEADSLSLTTYEKDGVLFYRLRDVASLLDTFGYKNNIVWDNSKGAITFDFNSNYVSNGTEFEDFKDQPLKVTPTDTTLYIEDSPYTLYSLNINGSNFYTAQDISEIYLISLLYNEKLDFNVLYLLETMEDTQEAILQTKSYDTTKKDNLPKDTLLQFTEPKEGETLATLITNYGDITVKFLPEYAPKAVENFISLSKADYYDGVTFHRVIEDFVIQGGDPTGTGYGGESIWGEDFESETNANLRHFTGALAMANSGLDSNGSQFYIVPTLSAPRQASVTKDITEVAQNETFLSNTLYDPYLTPINMADMFPTAVLDKYIEVSGLPELDFKYTVFGQVIEGQDIVDEISHLEVNDADSHPLKDVIIEDVVIFEYKK